MERPTPIEDVRSKAPIVLRMTRHVEAYILQKYVEVSIRLMTEQRSESPEDALAVATETVMFLAEEYKKLGIHAANMEIKVKELEDKLKGLPDKE